MKKDIKAMSNGLVVKNVDLFGDNIIAAQDNDGIIWAGVKWFCDAMGLSEGQSKYERKKIKEDLVLSKGTKFHPLGKDNANSDVLCLQLDYIPLWLAKISITPNMKETNPELVDKLVKYQLKAKDVLAAAFLPEPVQNTSKNNNTNVPHTLVYKGEPVITTSELARHYIVSNQNILQAFNRHKDYFKEGIHYFLLKAGEEVEFRKTNNLLISKSGKNNLYLWTRKGSLMFTKAIHGEVSWNQYKRILDILMDKTDLSISGQNVKPEKVNEQQIADNTGNFLPQDEWCVRNAYKIERICNTLEMDKKEFYHLVLTRIQEKYNMKSIENTYVLKNGENPKYAISIVDCSPELAEIADNVLMELIFSVMDGFSMMKGIMAAR